MTEDRRVAVIGAGAWGTALGMLLAEKDEFTVTLWSFEADVAESINDVHENRYLPGVRLPEALRAETDLSRTLKGASVVISASPAQVVREVMTEAASNVPTDALVVSASKGIEISTLLRMDEVLGQILPEQIMDRFCVLSGPGFAKEVAGHAPTAVVIAGRTTEAAKEAQKIFQRPYFRIYTNTDIVGVELGGALKNVVALAAGITSGLGYGHNTIAAVITRGLAEMTRLGVAMGGERATFSGLAGMGDLLLTCTGDLSRNRTVGYRLGQGESLEAILSDMKAVAEGVKTTESVYELARGCGVEMPIVEQVYAILKEDVMPEEALQMLMLREPTSEEWS